MDGSDRAAYSLNASVPGEGKRLASELFPRLVAFERVREEHTLLLKRFESAGPNREGTELATLEKRVRSTLVGVSAFEARIAGIDCFEEPIRGPGPVLYFTIESSGLDRVHRQLVAEFGAVAGLEGEAYTPHVTLARGGSIEAARKVMEGVEIDPIEWTVSELRFFDPRRRETIGRVPLSER
jgi:hypothetical protein